jgi:hypothetical protein
MVQRLQTKPEGQCRASNTVRRLSTPLGSALHAVFPSEATGTQPGINITKAIISFTIMINISTKALPMQCSRFELCIVLIVIYSTINYCRQLSMLSVWSFRSLHISEFSTFTGPTAFTSGIMGSPTLHFFVTKFTS